MRDWETFGIENKRCSCERGRLFSCNSLCISCNNFGSIVNQILVLSSKVDQFDRTKQINYVCSCLLFSSSWQLFFFTNLKDWLTLLRSFILVVIVPYLKHQPSLCVWNLNYFNFTTSILIQFQWIRAKKRRRKLSIFYLEK